MTEQKYPADIIETVAKANTEHGDLEYVEGAMPEGPWDGWGWVCKCGKVIDPATIAPVPAGVSMIDWWLAKHVAVVALDALGLTVTEEWGRRHPGGSVLRATADTVRYRGLSTTVVHRTVLHAETPWVEVTDDAE